MEREIHIKKSYGLSDRGSYVRLGFDVPDHTDRLELEYGYPRFVTEERPEGSLRREANIVDLGLFDERAKLRGWSGSERRRVEISAVSATPGYAAGAVGAGRWAVALGLYRIDSSVEVEITIRLPEKREALLVGDLHVHTLNSDGAHTTAEVVELARREGLDFVALTDHNNTRQNDEIGAASGITVIPGMEYTNYRGHANFLFAGEGSRFDVDPLSGSAEEMQAVVRAAKAAGAVVSVNHPHNAQCPWMFGLDGLDFDLVEAWNGPADPGNAKAIAWWHDLLCRGARTAVVGGSDFHRHGSLRNIGTPSTFVYSASRSVADIVAALLAGRCFVAASPSGPLVDLRVAGKGIGESVAPGEAREGAVIVRSARLGDRVRLLDARGRVTEWTVPFDGEHRTSFAVSADAEFYRMEVWRRHPAGLDLLAALTNPLTIS